MSAPSSGAGANRPRPASRHASTSGADPTPSQPDAASTALALFGDPADRGRTELADRVVVKIAARAAGEISSTVDVSPSLAQRLPGRHAAPAKVDATVSGRLVQLRVEIGVQYPTPIVTTTRAVREHVSATVTRLCSVEVRDVDVVVTRLRRPERARRVQ